MGDILLVRCGELSAAGRHPDYCRIRTFLIDYAAKGAEHDIRQHRYISGILDFAPL